MKDVVLRDTRNLENDVEHFVNILKDNGYEVKETEFMTDGKEYIYVEWE